MPYQLVHLQLIMHRKGVLHKKLGEKIQGILKGDTAFGIHKGNKGVAKMKTCEI